MKKVYFILFIVFPVLCLSQVKNIGTPAINNYAKSDYKGANQTWGMSQDSHGFMYFANNGGVLRFDGFNWESLDVDIPLPVRSVYVDANDRIFVGLIDNFGELVPGPSGRYEFRSYRDLIGHDIGFSDVWRIHEVKEGVVFQSFEKLFIYDGEEVRIFSPKEKYRFSFNVNGRLLVQEHELGLFEYFNGYFRKVPWAEMSEKEEIVSIKEAESGALLIGTVKGLYKYKNGRVEEWQTEANDFIKEYKLFSACKILDNHLAFGTILNGVMIADFNGNVMQVLNRDKGLQNNTVLSLFADRDENLWLGLDNGIDYLEINSPISYISDGGGIGTGYCCLIHDNRLYVGTNQGLFVKPFGSFTNNDERFKLIANTEGQVWSLNVFNGEVICGHNFGTFRINGDKATKIHDEPGGWKYLQPAEDPNTLIGGFYSGLVLFKYGQDGWQFHKKLNAFEESCRFMKQDEQGDLWVSHGSKGIFKIVINGQLDSISAYKMYNSVDGLPSDEKNILLPLNEAVYVSTPEGIYKYNSSNDGFEKAQEMSELFAGVGRIKSLKPDNDGNLWFVASEKTGVLRLNDDRTYTMITAPFESLKGKFVLEFEFLYPYSDDHVFYAIDNGFAHYSSKFSKSYQKNFSVFITAVELSNIDSVLCPPGMETDGDFEFPYRQNSFRFHYASPFFENLEDVKFSFKLENYSENWSEWTSDSYKDFTNLHEGNYQFKVKARNVFGVESEVAEYDFRVVPPWHRSRMAYYIYLALSSVIIYLLIRLILHRIKRAEKKEKLKNEERLQKQEEAFQHQALVAEKEIIKLRNDKLRAEMIHRDKELANQTNSIIQKNKFLMKLNQELQQVQNTTEDGAVKSKMVILKKRIDREIDAEQQNKIFETYFDEAHKELFERLTAKYPKLTPKDLRLCAYIRMDISSKEIATLLNISYRGVEVSRYRLRKKLDLPREVNLSTFLAGI